MKWLVIGIAGATCSGKTTLAKKLHEELKNSILINQDTYFRTEDDPRHIHVPQLNHHNWDCLESLDMEKMHSDVLKILSEPQTQSKEVKILIMDGFLLFNYRPIADLCQFKYFIDLPYEECEKRRKARVYDPADVPGYFELIVWPEYLRYKKKIEIDSALLDQITYIDGTGDKDDIFKRVLKEIQQKLNS